MEMVHALYEVSSQGFKMVSIRSSFLMKFLCVLPKWLIYAVGALISSVGKNYQGTKVI
jgi:hypothetical protein